MSEESLEVVDTESTYTCECGFSSYTAEAMLVHSCDPYKKHVEEEPLVRLQDAITILEEHRDRYEERRKAFDNYMQAESKKNQRVHQSVAAQNQDRVEILEKILEEFTQNGGSGE